MLCGRKAVGKRGTSFIMRFVVHLNAVLWIVDEVGSNTLVLLGDFNVNCPHNLAFGLGQRGGSVGKSSGRRGNGLRVF